MKRILLVLVVTVIALFGVGAQAQDDPIRYSQLPEFLDRTSGYLEALEMVCGVNGCSLMPVLDEHGNPLMSTFDGVSEEIADGIVDTAAASLFKTPVRTNLGLQWVQVSCSKEFVGYMRTGEGFDTIEELLNFNGPLRIAVPAQFEGSIDIVERLLGITPITDFPFFELPQETIDDHVDIVISDQTTILSAVAQSDGKLEAVFLDQNYAGEAVVGFPFRIGDSRADVVRQGLSILNQTINPDGSSVLTAFALERGFDEIVDTWIPSEATPRECEPGTLINASG